MLWFSLLLFVALTLGMSQKQAEMDANQRCIMQDLSKLKAAIIKRVPADDALDLYRQERYTEVAEFETFCSKLDEDQAFKDLFVSMMFELKEIILFR